MPAVGALDFTAGFDADQRRDDFGLEPVRVFERVVKDGVRDAGGVGRVVLDVDGQRRCVLGKLADQGFNQHAGWAFALGDDDEAVGQGMHGVRLTIRCRCRLNFYCRFGNAWRGPARSAKRTRLRQRAKARGDGKEFGHGVVDDLLCRFHRVDQSHGLPGQGWRGFHVTLKVDAANVL